MGRLSLVGSQSVGRGVSPHAVQSHRIRVCGSTAQEAAHPLQSMHAKVKSVSIFQIPMPERRYTKNWYWWTVEGCELALHHCRLCTNVATTTCSLCPSEGQI